MNCDRNSHRPDALTPRKGSVDELCADPHFTALGPTQIGLQHHRGNIRAGEHLAGSEIGYRRAIRAVHACDGNRFLPGGATVLFDGDRIVGVETARVDVPDGVKMTEYAGTVLPGLLTATPISSRTLPSQR